MHTAGESFSIRALEPGDLDVLFEIENDSRLWPLGISKEPLNREILTLYLSTMPGNLQRDGQLRMALYRVNSPQRALALVDLYDYDPVARKAGVGIAVLESERGKGLGAIALKELMDYSRNILALRMLHAVIPVENAASLALFEKIGFEHVGRLKDWIWTNGAFEDAHMKQIFL